MMIPESFHTPVLAAAIIAIGLIVIIPAIAVDDRREVAESASTAPDMPGGTSCALPPALDIGESGHAGATGPLSMDDNDELPLETATFALG
jgi:hypothetical protein